MMHIKRHTQKMKTSRTCFNFGYKKVTKRLTIISRMAYSIISTIFLFMKVNDCILSERLTPPRLQDILVLAKKLLTYKGMHIGPKCKKM